MFKRLLPMAAVLAAVVAGVYHLSLSTSTPAHAATPTVWSVDMQPDAAGYTAVPVINPTRAPVNVGSTFSVDAVVHYDDAPWGSYQVTLDYTDSILDAAGVPANWGNAPTATTGGNLFPLTGGSLCDPSPATNAVVSEDDINGNAVNGSDAEYAMTCGHAATSDTDTAGGTMVRFFFLCGNPGLATLHLRDVADTFILDNVFTSHNDSQVDGSVTCQVPPTNTPVPPTNTPAPATATPTRTNTATRTNTPAATNTPPFNPATMDKVPLGGPANVVVTGNGTIPAANLFLCEPDNDPSQPDGPADGDCDGPNEGSLTWIEEAFSPTTPVGAFEFQIKFDHKIFDINLECTTVADPGPACTLADTATWDIQLSEQLLSGGDGRDWSMDKCFRNITENYINFTCTSTGPIGAGYTGHVDLAKVTVHPDADLKFRLTPGNDNGIVRVILDENCELADPVGHPVVGSIAGGLTATCGDVVITVRILEGDLNLDCVVDLQDAQRIAQLYGMVFGLFLYDPWFDLEPNIHDFDIDAKDLQKVFGRIDSTCQNPIPPQPPLAPAQGN